MRPDDDGSSLRLVAHLCPACAQRPTGTSAEWAETASECAYSARVCATSTSAISRRHVGASDDRDQATSFRTKFGSASAARYVSPLTYCRSAMRRCEMRRSMAIADCSFGSRLAEQHAIIHKPPYSGTDTRYGVTRENARRSCVIASRMRVPCATGLAICIVSAPIGVRRFAQAL